MWHYQMIWSRVMSYLDGIEQIHIIFQLFYQQLSNVTYSISLFMSGIKLYFVPLVMAGLLRIYWPKCIYIYIYIYIYIFIDPYSRIKSKSLVLPRNISKNKQFNQHKYSLTGRLCFHLPLCQGYGIKNKSKKICGFGKH